MNQDLEHLNLLSIFHFVAAAITALIGCFPFIHLALGVAMITGSFGARNPPPPIMGWIFVLIAGFIICVIWAQALAIALAGLQLRRRHGWTFCFVVAVIECMIFPFGPILGAFTLVVLSRPSVKELFGRHAVPPAAAPA